MTPEVMAAVSNHESTPEELETRESTEKQARTLFNSGALDTRDNFTDDLNSFFRDSCFRHQDP